MNVVISFWWPLFHLREHLTSWVESSWAWMRGQRRRRRRWNIVESCSVHFIATLVIVLQKVIFCNWGLLFCFLVFSLFEMLTIMILSPCPNCSQRLSLHLNLLTGRVLSSPQTPYQAHYQTILIMIMICWVDMRATTQINILPHCSPVLDWRCAVMYQASRFCDFAPFCHSILSTEGGQQKSIK